MRKVPVLAAAALTLCALAFPAHGQASEGGRVLLPTGNPAVAKAEWNTVRSQGISGHVIRLRPGSDGKPYTLTTLHGLTNLEEFDAWFFEDDRGKPGEICSRYDGKQNGAVETGTICPNDQEAAWAIVVLFTGMDGRFNFSY